MKQTLNHNIDGKEYIITQLSPKICLKIIVRLSKIIGKPAGGAIGAVEFEGVKKGTEINMELLGSALGSLFDRIDEDEAIDTIEKLLSGVMFEGRSINLEHQNFQGQTFHLMKVAKAALEVNFSDFLGGSTGVLGILKARFSSMLANQT